MNRLHLSCGYDLPGSMTVTKNEHGVTFIWLGGQRSCFTLETEPKVLAAVTRTLHLSVHHSCSVSLSKLKCVLFLCVSEELVRPATGSTRPNPDVRWRQNILQMCNEKQCRDNLFLTMWLMSQAQFHFFFLAVLSRVNIDCTVILETSKQEVTNPQLAENSSGKHYFCCSGLLGYIQPSSKENNDQCIYFRISLQGKFHHARAEDRYSTFYFRFISNFTHQVLHIMQKCFIQVSVLPGQFGKLATNVSHCAVYSLQISFTCVKTVPTAEH